MAFARKERTLGLCVKREEKRIGEKKNSRCFSGGEARTKKSSRACTPAHQGRDSVLFIGRGKGDQCLRASINENAKPCTMADLIKKKRITCRSRSNSHGKEDDDEDICVSLVTLSFLPSLCIKMNVKLDCSICLSIVNAKEDYVL